MEAILDNLPLVAIAAILSLLGAGAAWGYAKLKPLLNKWLEKIGLDLDKIKADELLEQAVVDTYHGFVKDIKKDPNGDGKLSKEEAKQALDMAMDKAKGLSKDVAKQGGKDLFASWGKEALQWGIEKALSKIKGEAKAAK